MFKKVLELFNKEERENIELIRKSKYFDKQYYLLENPTVKGDTCKHYYYYGWKEGKSPSFIFSNDAYLKKYKDVSDAGINPLLHYLKFGKSENRIIENDNGYSLKKFYEKVYGAPYFYKTYIYDTEKKRINLFFNAINDSIGELKFLLEYLIKFCNNNNYVLRIIYSTADFEFLNHYLDDNGIKLPKDTTFLNLKSSNYLEIGLNDKYVCGDWQTARALLNTYSIHSNIFYYFTKDVFNYSKEDYYQVSRLCTNKRVIILTSDKKVINNLKKCELKIDVGDKKLIVGETNQLYCNLNKLSIVGLELLNSVFLTGVLDSNTWHINILEKDKSFKFHFDTEVRVSVMSDVHGNIDLFLQMSYDKKDVDLGAPFLNVWIEETDYKFYNVICLDDGDFSKLLSSKYDFSSTAVADDEKMFAKKILQLKSKE